MSRGANRRNGFTFGHPVNDFVADLMLETGNIGNSQKKANHGFAVSQVGK
jgi:hypothetical protein